MSDFDFIIYGNMLISLLNAYLYEKTGKVIFKVNSVLAIICAVAFIIIEKKVGGLK